MIAPSLFYIALSSEMGILSIPNDAELLSLVFRGLDKASGLQGLAGISVQEKTWHRFYDRVLLHKHVLYFKANTLSSYRWNKYLGLVL